MNLTLSVTDGAGVAQSSMTLVVNAARVDQVNMSIASAATPWLNVSDGMTVNISVAGYFMSNSKLQFGVYGLPLQTGLSLNTETGVLSGAPSASDFAAKQPLVVGLNACNERQCTGNLLFINLKSTRFQLGTAALSPDSVSVGASASADAFEVKFRVGTWGFFQTSRYLVSSGAVTYKVTGLPNGSGLILDSISGVIYGIPNLIDLSSADSRLGRAISISVTTSSGAIQKFILKFLLLGTDDMNHSPFARAIPSNTEPGKMFLLDVWTNFVDPDGDALTFSVIGLPESSGFNIIPSSGIFFGVPSQSDLSSQPLVLTIVANDQRGGIVQAKLSLTIARNHISNSSCLQLGWQTVSNGSFCSRAIKVAGVCPASMTFLEAQAACTDIGARLCASQELSVDASNDECPVGRVWSSSICAGSGIFTQASSKGINGRTSFFSSLVHSIISNFCLVTKECYNRTDAAMLKCCSDANSDTPDVKPHVNIGSRTCSDLPSFVTSPTTPNKAVCSAAALGENQTCSGSLTFAKVLSPSAMHS